MNILYDARTECYSVLTNMKIGDYIRHIDDAFSNKGGLSGQRDTLKTTTAKRIRDRMVSDIRYGAILPPVVIGVVLNEQEFEEFSKFPENPEEILDKIRNKKLSIIDGMQRTTALKEAFGADNAIGENFIRVEYWITKSIRALVYRMLVLNTGQVPWTLARQLSVVYKPLLDEIIEKVDDIERLITPDSPGRRARAGEYSSDAVIELYLSFALRKTNIDTKETLSDEFSRLDFVENLSEGRFQEQFHEALRILVVLDKAFSKYDSGVGGKMMKGRDIFTSQPARVGFITAIGNYVLGRPGMDRSPEERDSRLEKVNKASGEFIGRVSKFSNAELGDFLALDILREVLDKRVGQVGRYERAVYFDAFKVLIEEGFCVNTLEPCWRAN